MAKIIKLTESDLTHLVKKVIEEQQVQNVPNCSDYQQPGQNRKNIVNGLYYNGYMLDSKTMKPVCKTQGEPCKSVTPSSKNYGSAPGTVVR